MARFGFCAASSLILGGWGFAVPFYSVQDCTPLAHKKILRGGNIKTKSAAVAFFFFSSFLSPRSFYFTSPCSFLGGFLGSFCLRLLVFFSVKRLQFSFGTFSKIQQDNALGFTVTYTLILINVPTSYILKYTNFIFLKLFFYFLLKAGGETPHMKGVGMLVGNFELNPAKGDPSGRGPSFFDP